MTSVRIASNVELAAMAELPEVHALLAGYSRGLLNHPITGSSLRNYIILTDYPDILSRLGLSVDEHFWSRYYWLARLAREWQAIAGEDAGVEQQVFQLLESAEHIAVSYDPAPEVAAAAERDAVIQRSNER